MRGVAPFGAALRPGRDAGVLRHQDRLRLFTEADCKQRPVSEPTLGV